MAHNIEARDLLNWRSKRHMDGHRFTRPAAQWQQQDEQDKKQAAH